jgi:uncharacterized protein (DUF2164 family)
LNKYRVVLESIVNAGSDFINLELIIKAQSIPDAIKITEERVHDSTFDIFLIERIG